jgi:general secretion pathway protein L
MESSLKKCAITGFGHAALPEEGNYHDGLAEILGAISGEMDLRDCVCAMSIPSDRFFYRNVSVPFSETKKIQQMLPYELESVIPFSVEDLLIDFNKMPIPGSDGETQVITAGIETGRLKTLLDTVEDCGISPTVLLPGGYSTATWLCSEVTPTETALFLDCDGDNYALYLLIAGKISLIRSFSIPHAQAQSAIHLWSHIQRSLAGFESLFEVKISPEAIIANGFPEDKFARQLETVSSITVTPLNVKLPDHCEISDADREQFTPIDCFNGALSCTLYMLEGFKGMNFRKGPLASKNRLAEYRDRLIRTAIIAGAVILFWLGGVIIGTYITQNKVDKLQAQINNIFKTHFPNNPNTAEPAHQMRNHMETLKKAAFGSAENTSQVRSIDLLKDISRIIPNNVDVRFSKLNLSEDSISITASTTSFDRVEEIRSKIESLESIASITTSNSRRDGDRISFKLRIETRPEEAP